MSQHRGMIIRLRQRGDSQCTEAADCIEELKAENARLQEQIDELEAATE